MNLNKETKYMRLLTGLMLCGIVLLLIWSGTKKEGFHVDELYSYGLSNSEYLPFMHMGESGYDVKDWMLEFGPGESVADLFRNLVRDFRILKECDFRFRESILYQKYLTAQANSADTYTTTWVDGQEYRDYLAVSENNRFNYASVYYNQRGDVHPPFFYLLLHTICSLFPGLFSKWLGIALNSMIGVICLVVLYRFGKENLDETCGLLLVISYGFSCAFVSSVLFIRMYMLLTLLSLCHLRNHMNLIRREGAMTKREGLFLGLITFLGYYTHYYFVIYAIGTALVYGVWAAWHRKWKPLLQYVCIMAASALVGICLWPFSIKHVFLGYRGQASLQALSMGQMVFEKVKIMWNQFVPMIFGKGEWLFLLLLLIMLISYWVLAGGRKISYGKAALLVVPGGLYFILVSQMIPFFSDRYIMNLFPAWFILFLWTVAGLERELRKRKEIRIRLPILPCAVCLLFVLFNNGIVHTPGYLFPGGTDSYPMKENTDCIYVLPDYDWNESTDETNLLAQCDRVGVVYESNLAALKDDKVYTQEDNILLIVRNGLNTEKVLASVNETLFDNALLEVSRDAGASCTRIWLKTAAP